MTVAYDSENIFAKILRGEAPAVKVFEDEFALAFMDVMPQIDGHTLVIPKDDAETILDVDPEILGKTARTVQVVGAAVQAAFAAPGFMVAQLNGSAAGQTVPHLHFHILPRYEGLEFKMHAREMADFELLETHAQRIRSELS